MIRNKILPVVYELSNIRKKENYFVFIGRKSYVAELLLLYNWIMMSLNLELIFCK